MATLADVKPSQRPFRPYGAALDLFYGQSPEIVLSGPAGTGKSRACLEKLHLVCEKYPGARCLLVRKTRASLTQSAIVTYETKVLPEGSPIKLHTTAQEYRYPNGSVIVVGGLDKPTKVMSTEFDLAYVQEAIELYENDWESLTTRLRNGVVPYQQLIADTNPDGPTHWLKKRSDRGVTRMIESRHEDNPTVTPAYLAKLDALTGVRYHRLRHGRWVAAEGMVYDRWDRAIHLIDHFEIPLDWLRYWVVDFGYSHPFVWQEWAVDGDGRLYLCREICMTQRLVADHAEQIKEITADAPRPVRIICDHDAEDRATLERALGLKTHRAHKAISPGIQAVQERLRVLPDGKPRLFLLRDALVERDARLDDLKLPTCTEEEIDSYVWPTPGVKTADRKSDEAPVKQNDHGLDALRYMVAALDVRGTPLSVGPGELDAHQSQWTISARGGSADEAVPLPSFPLDPSTRPPGAFNLDF